LPAAEASHARGSSAAGSEHGSRPATAATARSRAEKGATAWAGSPGGAHVLPPGGPEPTSRSGPVGAVPARGSPLRDYRARGSQVPMWEGRGVAAELALARCRVAPPPRSRRCRGHAGARGPPACEVRGEAGLRPCCAQCDRREARGAPSVAARATGAAAARLAEARQHAAACLAAHRALRLPAARSAAPGRKVLWRVAQQGVRTCSVVVQALPRRCCRGPRRGAGGRCKSNGSLRRGASTRSTEAAALAAVGAPPLQSRMVFQGYRGGLPGPLTLESRRAKATRA
jgi:hypothetical protein